MSILNGTKSKLTSIRLSLCSLAFICNSVLAEDLAYLPNSNPVIINTGHFWSFKKIINYNHHITKQCNLISKYLLKIDENLDKLYYTLIENYQKKIISLASVNATCESKIDSLLLEISVIQNSIMSRKIDHVSRIG